MSLQKQFSLPSTKERSPLMMSHPSNPEGRDSKPKDLTPPLEASSHHQEAQASHQSQRVEAVARVAAAAKANDLQMSDA
jgi:hypothetical protein